MLHAGHIIFKDREEAISVEGLQFIKMLRLTRLARLARLLRFKAFRELKLMVEGVVSGLRVLAWAIVLLGLCIYILGAVLRMTIGTKRAEFSTLARCMLTLFRCFTDGCSAYDGTPLQGHLHRMYGHIFVA